jgi:DNA (cytosine-5)-methyltransferase 1
VNELRTMHLFAGVGGGLLCDLILGHRPVVAVEWEQYACQVLRERAAEGWFPGLHVWEGDVRLFDPSEYAGKVDCIHAGFPCQDISVAGKQAGVSEGTRSGLYREVLRIAGIVRPKYMFLENVAAILSNGLGTVLGDLAAMGYDTRWCCIRASDVGAPHHRDRWWLLASNSECIGQQVKRGFEHEVCSAENPYREAEWLVDAFQRDAMPYMCRRHDGVPNPMDCLKALGNAQVPLQAATAWKLLGGE